MRHMLYDYTTDEPIRPASKQEVRRFGHIQETGPSFMSVQGRRCYVQEG